MQVSDLENNLTRFYSHLYIIAKKYGRLHRAVGRYFQQPLFRQSRGLTVNTQRSSGSYRASPTTDAPENQPNWAVSNTNIPSSAPSLVPSIAQNFPILSAYLPAVFQRNSTWKAVTALPSSAQFDAHQGHFVPFVSSVRSQKQTSGTTSQFPNSGRIQAEIPDASNPTPCNEPSATPPTNPNQQLNSRVSFASIAKRLTQVAFGIPLIPTAISPISATSTLTPSPAPSNPPTIPALKIQGPTDHGPTTTAQSTSRGLSPKHFSLPKQAVAALPYPVAFLHGRPLPIPVLGLNRALAGRSFPNLARASRLAEARLSVPTVTNQGAYTSSPPVGAPQNLSQIVSAYANTEASQTKLHLTSRTLPRTIAVAQLPGLQQSRREIGSHTSPNNRAVAASELPTLQRAEGESSSTMTVQGETLPRLSEWESRNFELGETDDQISMEELRSKISRILWEELRRYLPGE